VSVAARPSWFKSIADDVIFPIMLSFVTLNVVTLSSVLSQTCNSLASNTADGNKLDHFTLYNITSVKTEIGQPLSGASTSNKYKIAFLSIKASGTLLKAITYKILSQSASKTVLEFFA